MSFGLKNSSRFKIDKKKASVIDKYQSGQIDYETYKQLTTPRVAGVPFTGRLRDTEKYFDSMGRSKMASIGSMSMSSSFGSLTSSLAASTKLKRSLKASSSGVCLCLSIYMCLPIHLTLFLNSYRYFQRHSFDGAWITAIS